MFAYFVGFDSPRTLSEDKSRILPDAKFVSNTVHKGDQSGEDPKLSQWVIQFGQLLDLDISLTYSES